MTKTYSRWMSKESKRLPSSDQMPIRRGWVHTAAYRHISSAFLTAFARERVSRSRWCTPRVAGYQNQILHPQTTASFHTRLQTKRSRLDESSKRWKAPVMQI